MNDILEHHDYQHHEDVVSFMRRNFSASHGGQVPPDIPLDLGTLSTLEAFVNDSRWIVACPTPGCGSAFIVDSRSPLYLCMFCGNSTTNGAWLRVVFPQDKRSIETTLRRRPKLSNRNWLPSESVADLERENMEHGVI